MDNMLQRSRDIVREREIHEETTILFDCLIAQKDQAPYLGKDDEGKKARNVRIFRNHTGRYYDRQGHPEVLERERESHVYSFTYVKRPHLYLENEDCTHRFDRGRDDA